MLICRRYCFPLAIIAILALGGCGGLLESKRPAIQSWWLEPLETVAPTEGGSDRALQLELRTAPGLDSNRIMSLDPQARFGPYAGSVWVEDLPKLLRFLLIRSLGGSGRFSEVGERIPAGTDSPCRLDLQVIAFHGRLDSSGLTTRVEVAFEGLYRCGDASRSVNARSETRVPGNRMPEIVAAFQQSLDQATQALLSQIEP